MGKLTMIGITVIALIIVTIFSFRNFGKRVDMADSDFREEESGLYGAEWLKTIFEKERSTNGKFTIISILLDEGSDIENINEKLIGMENSNLYGFHMDENEYAFFYRSIDDKAIEKFKMVLYMKFQDSYKFLKIGTAKYPEDGLAYDDLYAAAKYNRK